MGHSAGITRQVAADPVGRCGLLSHRALGLCGSWPGLHLHGGHVRAARSRL